MAIPRINDINLAHKRVLIREDFNVPLVGNKITSDARIKAALPTIEYALKHQAKVIILSHIARPEEGKFDPQFSLKPVAERLSELLNKPVKLVSDWLDGIEVADGEIVLCENVRFEKGEKQNDPALAKKIAALGDIFIMDAFAVAHRAEASTVGVAQYAKEIGAGFLLMNELDALDKALKNPARPLVSIVGGAKVSSKLKILDALIDKSNQVIVGGGIANTFLAAKGINIGKSLVETDLIPFAKNMLERESAKGMDIVLPIDVVVAKEFSADAKTEIKPVTDVDPDEMILDVGPKSAHIYAAIMQAAGTILWNGPVGVFELEPFSHGTKTLALGIAESKAFSIAGGGDTIAAIEKFNIADKISYISTGGGAFLEFVEGIELPAVKILQERSKK